MAFFKNFFGGTPVEPDPAKLSAFRSKIKESLVVGALDKRKRFLPISEVSKLVTPNTIKSLLPYAPQGLVDYICQDAQKLFLTVVWCRTDVLATMEAFRDYGLADHELPINDPESGDGPCGAHVGGQCNHKDALNVFHSWAEHDVSFFYRDQWIFCAPVFDMTNFRQEFKPDCILPFTTVSKDEKGGHFSTVSEATIHIKHCLGDTKGNRVALKKLRDLPTEPGYHIERAWEQEAAALSQISELRHRHLISRTGAFKRGDEYYIMFEWADGGTLRDVWENQGVGTFDLNRDRVMAVLEQLAGLAGALSRLHNTNTKTRTAIATSKVVRGGNLRANSRARALLSPPRSDGGYSPPTGSSNTLNVPQIRVNPDSSDDEYYTSDNFDEDLEKHWRHGDLKPDNILQFKDPKNWLGILKIADLGLAKQHAFATSRRNEQTDQKYSTSHYEAPEVITNQNLRIPRSRRYDTWCFGCIVLEFSIWLLYGYKGLDKFYKEANNITNKHNETLYFTVRPNTRTAQVSRIATTWMEQILQSDPECKSRDSAIRDLIELAKGRLLVVALPNEDMSTKELDKCRADAGELEETLGQILAKARDDEHRGGTYVCTGPDRRGVQAPQGLSFLSASSAGQAQQSRPPNLFDETWNFLEDNSFATGFLTGSRMELLDVFPRQAASLCAHCMQADFWTQEIVIKDTLSNIALRSKTCDFHHLIHTCSKDLDEAAVVEVRRVGSTFVISGVATPGLMICRAPETRGFGIKPPKDIHIGLPKLPQVDSSMFNRLLSQWLEDCDQNHKGCRRESQGPIKNPPTRLIDVGQEGIQNSTVHLRTTADVNIKQTNYLRYIALSHPWGSAVEHDHFCTTRKNFKDRLRNGMDINQLPNTFKHAVLVTKALGIRYLWIDSLCIIQGDDGDFETEARNMETVFSSAYCVIAASRASGTSSGFLWTRPGRRFVNIGKTPLNDLLYVCEPIDDFQHDVIEGTLNQRGWVLQERVLARRTIYFTEKQTYWECGEGVRCETLSKMKNNKAAFLGDPNFPEVATISSRGARIRLYESLYKQYSRLSFSKACDRPIALAGLEQRLVNAFETHGGYGVFEGRFFGRSLLWKRDKTVTEKMNKIDFPKHQKYLVPTWSWMAYEGAITFMDIPFNTVDWEHERVRDPGIRSPWTLRTSSSSSYSWHTGNSTERVDLIAHAKELVNLDLAEKGIIYDQGSRPLGDRDVRCVVVGRQKAGSKEVDLTNLDHYVLIVASREEYGRDGVYERVGVGSLLGSQIVWDRGDLRVSIF
ncbi:hypothetical protein NM208_g2926 [Fusarium decemcellulare]|uniref:Uncharacterized protein n=1 Tax=Fusarium decemcellulare TaxID=57161 RepID=A0ACC1SR25_9HYPO|nr:hypothetical protein NM208_g2926 [Fusarium decemcellulare]